MPLPEAPSFFWGRTIQGEVYVKGLGEDRSQAVKSLTVTARLLDRATGMPDMDLASFPTQTLYPPSGANASSSAAPPFPLSHRFALELPPSLRNGSPLPGGLDLGPDNAIRWFVDVNLTLATGEVVTEQLRVEGVPPELDVGEDPESEDAVARLERAGVSVRLVLSCTTPRLGDSLHIGVEVCPARRERTGLAGLVAQPDPNEVLRPLRRVRVELVRVVNVAAPPQSSAAGAIGGVNTVSTTVHASGKSLRYPGAVGKHPPLRVLFALPTAQIHQGMLATGGEISARTTYHDIHFVVRATLGFGERYEQAQSSSAGEGWTVEQEITVRPPAWREPATVVIEGGMAPAPGIGGESTVGDDVLSPPPEDDSAAAREAYRRKGRDVVGAGGTTRVEHAHPDAPPPFDGAGPSGSHSADMDTDTDSDTSEEPVGLPSFNESEAQMRSGAAPRLHDAPESERLQPVAFEECAPSPSARRPSLHGELASWTEYDGYETFSMAPPPAAASFGVPGIMDPPGDEAANAAVAGDIAARLGLGGAPSDPAALMEQLGLAHGRVVDLQDDLPPGIDEPSLPALPGFGGASRGFTREEYPRFMDPFAQRPHVEVDHPPSFDASEAAEAIGGVARSRVGSVRMAIEERPDAPPGYFGGPHVAPHGGPPAYGS
ncbi:hypothetical protein CC85DRAFT_328823 [Cutaneotrichosporon oleaginosum]|uniref:Uncharacterized protein n=1 Tax=Cutaneotrichosporon oleaginosum TaxID=879819 RepID=A0A0J0XKR3_9TREE|nr:uncharacterized protein CC85DRAFT_328823 [Cutaneotrichosporon oleaginosum]KLT41675.1 hypothetical protein CC85DRAFT_328823 [Cutaneotrichosporon oleaginosum]TXT08047.1 hypothetical protein COLE_04971 [Cutaneotrichosporon oleaginosum]